LSITRIYVYGLVLLFILSWGYVLFGGDSGLAGLISGKTWSNAGGFLRELAGIGSGATPAYLQLDQWVEKGKLAYHTLAMSVLAMIFAVAGVALTFLPAAQNMGNGELGGTPSRLWTVLYYLVRGTFILTRAIPELVWALIIIFFLSPGILPGALALGLHNYGVLGKLSAEVVEDLDPRPTRALRAAGGSNFQMLFYGIIPQALPQFLTYMLYRWEVVIRTTVVVGFVSAGGLGREFRLSLSFFHYSEVALIIFWYLLLVVGVDLLSAWLRRLARFD
jgi:phosphonate transport system permease protein